MADRNAVYTASTLLRTGRGQLVGLSITSSSTTATTATLYDNTAGSGTKIYEANVSAYSPVTVFFSERMALDFTTGLYLALGSNLTATIWWREY